ncbi:MAG: tetratricopeptide repeat protein [Thermodesulfovibrionales bacterium]
MKRLLTTLLLCLAFAAAAGAGDDYYDSQLNRGIRSDDTYAYALMKQADLNKPEAERLLKAAAGVSPDLPAVYFRLAAKTFSFSGGGLLKSIDYMVSGGHAYARNFWWSFTLVGAVYLSLVLSFILSAIVLLCVRFSGDIPLLTHDIRETPSRAALLAILLLLSALSPLLFIAGCLILTGIYMKKIDRSVVYLFLLFLAFMPLLLSTASLFINASSSGKLKAVVQINELKGNTYALATLKDDPDFPAAFSYALALKHEGQYPEAVALYQKLQDTSQDPRVMVNLGNCYVGFYNFEEDKKSHLNDAARYYTLSISTKPSASAYYNLSVVSRELLDFEKGDEYFKAALNVDRIAVERVRAVASRNSNRFVIDDILSLDELWAYARTKSTRVLTFGLTALPPAVLSLIAILLIPVFYLLPDRLRYFAYRCRKCNTILCNRCERELVIGQICSQCYGSMIKLAELDVKERVARILSIYEQQKKRRDIMKILSFVVPGTAHLYSGKILYGFLMLWPFMFFILFPVVSSFFFPANPLISHGFMNGVALCCALLLYITSNILTRQGISKGWL